MAIYVIGTCDTKSAELCFARDLIRRTGAEVRLVDVGIRESPIAADVTAAEVAAHHPQGAAAILGATDRGVAVTAMGEGLAGYLQTRTDIDGVLGLGGSGNTALVTFGMRALPIGTPKLMLSTVAAGNVAPYVGPNDIAMMYSVTDIAGLNVISRQIISNAAHAIAGMATYRAEPAASDKPGLGMTMFGVTTPCVDMLRRHLEADYECFVFHATGVGGQSMEKLADSRLLSGFIDTTTTEVADMLVGGVFACSEDRFGAVARTRLPYVGAPGALDMVNFGEMQSVPAQFAQRNLYRHNPQVTLMRTTALENRDAGEWIASRLNQCEGEVRFLLPQGGVSALDAPGQAFHDPEADAALFAGLEGALRQSKSRRLVKLPHHINEPAFAAALAAAFREIAQ